LTTHFARPRAFNFLGRVVPDIEKNIHIVVAGGETQGTWKMISGALRGTVSIDRWR
jgi:hypothetical protein